MYELKAPHKEHCIQQEANNSWYHFHSLFSHPFVGSQTGPGTQRARRDRRKRHSRLAGGRFNRQGNLHMRLVLGSQLLETQLSQPAHCNLKFIWRPYLGCHVLVQMVPAPRCSLKAAFLKTASNVGTMGRWHIPKQGRGCGASGCAGPAHRSTCGSILLMTSSYTPALTL